MTTAACVCVFFTDDDIKDDLAGTTANVVLVKNNKIYCVSGCEFIS